MSRGKLQTLLGMPQLTQLTLGLKDASEVSGAGWRTGVRLMCGGLRR